MDQRSFAFDINPILQTSAKLILQEKIFACYAFPQENSIELQVNDHKDDYGRYFCMYPFNNNKYCAPFEIHGSLLRNDLIDCGAIDFNNISKINKPINSFQISIDQTCYAEYFKQIKNKIDTGVLNKIVVSRNIKIDFCRNPIHLFKNLLLKHTNAFVSMVNTPNNGLWIGASPEILIRSYKTKHQYKTVSLAGTLHINDNKHWEEKEYDEQDIVTKYITNALERTRCSNIQNTPTQELQSGNLKHLKTDISFQNKDVAKVIQALHPTPATCGTPKSKALKHILNVEPGNRLFYSGYVGIKTKRDVHLFVNLRCIQIVNHVGYIYVGGGITRRSELEQEWQETEAKSNTIKEYLF